MCYIINYFCCYSKRENIVFKGIGVSSCRELIMLFLEELCGFIMLDFFCNENWMYCLEFRRFWSCLNFKNLGIVKKFLGGKI